MLTEDIMKIYKKVLCVGLFALMSSISYSQKTNIQILFTSDEHGWMLNEGKNGGAAEMYEQWLTQDSIKFKNTLILSGGDNFTGPAISTYTKGHAMLEVMNAMGYQYSTVGNHEFDFGQNELVKLLAESKCRYIATNLKYGKNENKLSKDIKLFSEFEIDGVKILIIGLANMETPSLSSAKNIQGLEFADYLKSMQMFKDKIKNNDIAILLTHLCADELKKMEPNLVKMGFDVITGGHCHTPVAELIDGVPIIEGNPNLRGYAKIPIVFDKDSKKIVSISAEQVPNNRLAKNPLIESIINKWKDSTDKILSQPIGYCDNEIANQSPELINLILNSWLKQIPNTDIAITNRGSIRQGIPKGDIKISTIMGIMPFDNELVTVEMYGADIKELITKMKPFVAGVDVNNDFTLDTGSKLIDKAKYKVIVNNFIYNGGDKYDFKSKSKLISNTGINMREPLREQILKAKSSWNRPINSTLDNKQKFE